MSSGASPVAADRLPGNLQTNRRLSRWLSIRPEGFVDVSPGKVEIGQGIYTALAQIVADELDIDLARVRFVRPSTASSPNEGVTSGSLSIQDCGGALRHAAAEARVLYLEAAAQRLGVAPESLGVEDGTIAGAGNLRTSYWELADDRLLAREASAGVAPKPATSRRVAGTAAHRIDIPDKVFGSPRFVHDVRLPDMVHGRVLRPSSVNARLASLDEGPARSLPGVIAVVRDGSFAGVVAAAEDVAIAALERLRSGATWEGGESLPDEANLAPWLKCQAVESKVIDAREAAAPAQSASTFRRTYTRPYIAHASIAPSCAIARWSSDGVQVWTHSQGIFNLRTDLALVLSLPVEQIVVEHVEGAGCYGHNGADDAALDAALLARAAKGRPVRVQWSREDEMSWAPVGACAAIDLEADLDSRGEVVGWRHDVWCNGHVSRPGRAKTPTLLAGYHLAQPFPRLPSLDPPFAGGAVRSETLCPTMISQLGRFATIAC